MTAVPPDPYHAPGGDENMRTGGIKGLKFLKGLKGEGHRYTMLLTMLLTMLYKIHQVGTRSIKKGRVTQWLLTSLNIS